MASQVLSCVTAAVGSSLLTIGVGAFFWRRGQRRKAAIDELMMMMLMMTDEVSWD